MSFLNSIKKGQKAKAPKIMLIGVEGVGKSTAGAAMPSPVFICGENGLVGPQFSETASFTPSSWADILGFLDELATSENPFRTVVIDTLDWVEPMLYAHVCKVQGKGCNSIEDFGYGKGYVIAQQEARQLISRLERLNNAGYAVLILSHCMIKTFQNPVGDNYDRYEPKVNLKVAGLFKEWCDAVLFAQFDFYTEKSGNKTIAFGGDVRIVHTTHSTAWDAKNRYGLPETMPLDMPTIMQAIKEGQPEDTDSMVKEFRSLAEKMSDKTRQEKAIKWLDDGKWTVQKLAEKLNVLRNEFNNDKKEDK